jgi:hypothetical protein
MSVGKQYPRFHHVNLKEVVHDLLVPMVASETTHS